MDAKYIKIYRYASIYGLGRTLTKAVGRAKRPLPLAYFLAPMKFCKIKDIAMIGCGQFAFATIGYFITKEFGRRFLLCFDVSNPAANFFSKCYKIPNVPKVSLDNAHFKNVKLAYIASNHASHTEYAIYFLNKNIDVYIEKPISVTKEQLTSLKEAAHASSAKIYFGYNRPFSQAIKELTSKITEDVFTLNCVVIGHLIPEDHWYRDPREGTRVCGNLGHWIDLSIHLLAAANRLGSLKIQISYSDENHLDDNITVTMTTKKGDLITLTLTSREEPFEGINETIIFQQKNLFAKIDDFRKAEFYQSHKKQKRKYKPKDVGHKNAILQPFSNYTRCQEEVFLSTDLMLHIKEMVNQGKILSTYHIL